MKHMLILLALTVPVAAQSAPRTVAESSDWKRTSTNADVWEFLARLDGLAFRTRIQRSILGYSVEGRRLAHVTVPSI